MENTAIIANVMVLLQTNNYGFKAIFSRKPLLIERTN